MSLFTVCSPFDVSISEGDSSAVGKGSEFDEDIGIETMTFALPGMGVKKIVLTTAQMNKCMRNLRRRILYANLQLRWVALLVLTRKE